MPGGLFSRRRRHKAANWLLQDQRAPSGPHSTRPQTTAPWWQVMCLTGVDYFSTLGYQPSIAFAAAGVLSPIATIILVLVTLFAALPMYNRVAGLSPHGQGSISLLEQLLPRWRGKAFVLCLLGFAATGFVITITLSAADATAHLVENPMMTMLREHRVAVTLVLIAALGAVFLKGFEEVLGIAVGIVAVYLVLNLVIVAWGMNYLWQHPDIVTNWRSALTARHGNPLVMFAAAAVLFPRLALGLSGFETGVAVMPLVRGQPDDDPDVPAGRIHNTRKLLRTAALIMSVMLIGSSFVSALLIPPNELMPGGEASGRALAYLAHEHFGETFGTIYDLSTIMILWFAGASAMAGLLNLVPRYLPRYGMAPEWAKATRPLVLIFVGISALVTVVFDADVEAQGGAYATGVLALMTSAAVAVALWAWRHRHRRIPYLLIAIVFVYTTFINMVERPEGIKIAAIFIVSMVVTSLVSRVARSTELRIHGIVPDEMAARFIDEAGLGSVRIIANRPGTGDAAEYEAKLKEARDSHHLPSEESILFLEVRPGDASEFSDVLEVRGAQVEGHRVLQCESPAIPNAIAALLLFIRDRTKRIPHAYFGWTEGNPITYLLKFLAFGEGDTAPVTREVLRQAEAKPERRPRIHVG